MSARTEPDRVAGALLGLAIGDAAGWPSVRHRAHLLPPWTRRLHRELVEFSETEQVTTLPVPFSLNQPTQPLRLGPSDDAEWAAWTARWLLDSAGPITRAGVHAGWRRAALDEALPRGRISVATAADSLRRGIDPPVSGHDNPHHFDDAAAIRAVAIAAAVPDPARAAQVAGWDAEVTNADDGVAAAQVIAETVARLIAGEPLVASWTAAASRLPSNGLLAETTERALAATARAGSPAEAVPALAELVDHVYSYGVAAAQTVPVALALAQVNERSRGAPIDAVTAAVCLPALADSAPALAGALVGAACGADSWPAGWVARCRWLAGCCTGDLAGTDLVKLARQLAAWRGESDS